ncbi:MAG TPA: winged helix-turn-helix domain-containing protein [Streptosporangiaceae bacterium]|nr:winged helix-turn-helix domain-containing protein [Streptosporangiaceae bacterium]
MNYVTAEQLAFVAGLLADRTRAAICLALLDGRAWTVSELARHARVAPSTASEHVTRLVNGGILIAEHQGRHRYVRLADSGVAQLVEDLGALTGPPSAGVRSLRAVRAAGALARARTCYDHLAGRLGVEVTEAMTRAGLLDQAGGFALTPAGLGWLADSLDVDVAALTAARRPIARSCLDWTERRPHLGGGAGAAVCTAFFARGWIARTAGTRAVVVTASGELALRQLCGINLDSVA